MSQASLSYCAKSSTAGLWLAQMAVGLAALMACAFAPRTDQPMLLVPFGASARISAQHWASAHDLRLLGRGRLPGSLIVQSASAVSPLSALRAGAVLLAVPGLTCDTQSPKSHPPLM
jgi:hypothetical protein